MTLSWTSDTNLEETTITFIKKQKIIKNNKKSQGAVFIVPEKEQKYLCIKPKKLGVCNQHTRFKNEVIQVNTIKTSQIQIQLANKNKANNTDMNRPYPQSNIGTPYLEN